MSHDARPWSIDALRTGGFQGFVPVRDASGVPEGRGVYAVLRASDAPVRFLAASPAGRVRGEDPTVEAPVLERRWLDGPQVLYLGTATRGAAGRGGLRRRIDELRRFAAGEPVAHRGGRYLWQLADGPDLLVAWHPADDPAALAARMLQDFVDRYGALPFANLRR